MRPRPQRGLGWRKGGDKIPENRFSTEQKFSFRKFSIKEIPVIIIGGFC
jgi:hypothetical protein